jgi:lactoylglutathione lyase
MRIIHVNVNVLDIERSIAFYREALGCELLDRHCAAGYDEGELKVAYLRAPGSPLEIELSEYAGRSEPYDYGGGKFGFAHIAVCVDDLELEHRRLAALASAITPIEDYVANGRRMSRYFFMRDPDGFPIEVIERNHRYR